MTDLRHPPANQEAIDRQSAGVLRATWCPNHQRPLRKYANGVLGCPECIADHLVYEGVSPWENWGEDA